MENRRTGEASFSVDSVRRSIVETYQVENRRTGEQENRRTGEGEKSAWSVEFGLGMLVPELRTKVVIRNYRT